MKAISFSLYGTDPTYSVGAVKNVRLYKQQLPDYRCVFWVGQSVSQGARDEILSEGGLVVPVSGREDWTAALWRFKILRNLDFSHYLFRDTDCRPSDRETDAVRAWEHSGKAFHVMRDHPAHGAPMLAGMWGCTREGAERAGPGLPDINRLAPSTNYDEHIDQGWLEQYVWPLAQQSGLIHSDYYRTTFGPSERFPTARVEGFVGEGYFADDSLRNPQHHNLESLCQSCQCSISCPQ
jgi:hypothetical protein